MERFGLGQVPEQHSKFCGFYLGRGCKSKGKVFIGDTKNPYLRSNFFLCDEHLHQVFNQLVDVLQPNISSLEQRNDIDSIKHQETTNNLLNLLYDSSGVLSKANLKEFCKNNGVDLPEDDLNMKGYIELIFPELKEDK